MFADGGVFAGGGLCAGGPRLQALVGEQAGERLVGRAEQGPVRAEPRRSDGRRRHHAEGHQPVVVGGGDFVCGEAEQLGPEGIRANTVCPGAILTPMIEPLYEQAPQRKAAMEARTPLRRLGTPLDVARAVTFLLSPDASFITGIDLVVDGGWTIQTK